MDRHIFLIGFMGSGKTYWGRRLAPALGCAFLDLDAWIEEGEQRTIADIFAGSGETGFRVLEQQYLHRLAALPPAVVATGGGTPCFFDNMDWMKRRGHTIYLETPPGILAGRLKKGRDRRPLLKSLDDAGLEIFIRERLAAREPFYRQAEAILTQTGDSEADRQRLLEIAGSWEP